MWRSVSLHGPILSFYHSRRTSAERTGHRPFRLVYLAQTIEGNLEAVWSWKGPEVFQAWVRGVGQDLTQRKLHGQGGSATVARFCVRSYRITRRIAHVSLWVRSEPSLVAVYGESGSSLRTYVQSDGMRNGNTNGYHAEEIAQGRLLSLGSKVGQHMFGQRILLPDRLCSFITSRWLPFQAAYVI